MLNNNDWIYTLNNTRDKKIINRYKIFKKVLEKCYYKIKNVSSQGASFLFYVVPEYLFGLPRYNKINCANFIIRKLNKNGFKTKFINPNLIFISWQHIPSQYKNYQVSKKKKTKTNINKFKNLDFDLDKKLMDL